MTLRHLKNIIAVYETGSISKAAEMLNVSQPSVSIAIREIEETYDIKLFERYNKRMKITPIGRKIEHYAKNIIQMYDELDHTINPNNDSKIIRIGSSYIVGESYLYKYIKIFEEAHPEVKIKIKVAGNNIIENMLCENELDLAIIDGETSNNDIISKKICNFSYSLVCSSNHKFANRNNISVNELIKERIIIGENDDSSRKVLNKGLLSNNKIKRIEWECDCKSAILSAVINDLGVSLIPSEYLKLYNFDNKLSKFSVENMLLSDSLNFVYHKDKEITSIMSDIYRIAYEQSF